MKDFLTFRTMMDPILIQILFWLIMTMIIIVAILDIMHHAPWSVLFQVIILAPIVTRVICELLILFFRINDNLVDIKKNLN